MYVWSVRRQTRAWYRNPSDVLIANRAYSHSRLLACSYEETIRNLNISKKTRVIYQGFTGKTVTINVRDTIAYGTNIVGGVSPGKGGRHHLDLPLFDNVFEAVAEVQPDASAIFVPASHTAGAIMEAIEAEISLVVSVAEHIPVHDMLRVHEALKTRNKTRLVGPNCPGIIAPGSTTRASLGQSLVFGMGGDMLPGTNLVDGLKFFLKHQDTEGVIVIGEIGGDSELRAAEVIDKYRQSDTRLKPIIAMVVGRTAPIGRTMGHAGAILSAGSPTAMDKILALESAGAVIVTHPGVMGDLMATLLA